MDQTSFSLLVGLLAGAPAGAVGLSRLTGWSLWITCPIGGLIGLILGAVVTFVFIALLGGLLSRSRRQK